jgi:N-dimethylarginine dimethylaminohydrolase
MSPASRFGIGGTVSKKTQSDITGQEKYRTPSQSPFPVFALCQPMYVDTKVANNIWMKEMKGKDKQIDHERFMGEWYNFVKLLSSDSLVYLIPPKKGLQDQTYVNSFCYLPHIEDKDVIILSNFTAPGRAGEEDAAGSFLAALGYECVKSPYKFEGEPELKYLRDNIYFGGYGFRTQIETHRWLERVYDAKVISIEEKDEHLYHLDCTFFVLNEENVMCCVEGMSSATKKAIEKVATIHPVTMKACHENICNSVRVADLIITSSSLLFMQKRDPDYKDEWKKNDELEDICNELGLEVLFIEMSEAAKSGAALSCFVGTLHRGW